MRSGNGPSLERTSLATRRIRPNNESLLRHWAQRAQHARSIEETHRRRAQILARTTTATLRGRRLRAPAGRRNSDAGNRRRLHAIDPEPEPGLLLGHVGMERDADHGGDADRREIPFARACRRAAAVQRLPPRALRGRVRAAVPTIPVRQHGLEPAGQWTADGEIQRRHPGGIAVLKPSGLLRRDDQEPAVGRGQGQDREGAPIDEDR